MIPNVEMYGAGLTYKGKVADAWAMGITLYCMIVGNCPFIGDSLQETYDKVLSPNFPVQSSIICSCIIIVLYIF